MAGPNNLITKTFEAGAAIAKHTIVKFDSADDTVTVATGVTDLPIGISLEAAANAGDRIEVAVAGIAEVKSAGVIARGAAVVATSGGEGKAGTAATAKQNAIGYAMNGVADNDIFPCMISRSQFDLA